MEDRAYSTNLTEFCDRIHPWTGPISLASSQRLCQRIQIASAAVDVHILCFIIIPDTHTSRWGDAEVFRANINHVMVGLNEQ